MGEIMLLHTEHKTAQASAPSDVSPAEPKKKRTIGFASWKDNTPHSGLLRRMLTFRLCRNQK